MNYRLAFRRGAKDRMHRHNARQNIRLFGHKGAMLRVFEKHAMRCIEWALSTDNMELNFLTPPKLKGAELAAKKRLFPKLRYAEEFRGAAIDWNDPHLRCDPSIGKRQ